MERSYLDNVFISKICHLVIDWCLHESCRLHVLLNGWYLFKPVTHKLINRKNEVKVTYMRNAISTY